MLYIDDLVEEMIAALTGQEHRCEFDGLETVLQDNGKYCAVPITHKVTLGEIVDLLHTFAEQPRTLMVPEIPDHSFAKKLYSTYLSYLPKEKVAFPLKMNADERGSFTELLRTAKCGQVSVNISKPGITKGQHWHHTKWEFFIVVSGHGLIQQRKVGSDEIIEFGGVKIKNREEVGRLQMFINPKRTIPAHISNLTHITQNDLSDTENLVTVMWANELFDPNHPDTFFEKVVKE